VSPRNSIILGLLVVLVIAGVVAIPAQVYAGSNGQQLLITDDRITGLPGYKYVTVSGPNQSGQIVTKNYTLDDKTSGHHSLTTWGYWWKSTPDSPKVTILVTFTNNRGWTFTKNCSAVVPQQYHTDVFKVICRYP
jgi:hypothetical protein